MPSHSDLFIEPSLCLLPYLLLNAAATVVKLVNWFLNFNCVVSTLIGPQSILKNTQASYFINENGSLFSLFFVSAFVLCVLN